MKSVVAAGFDFSNMAPAEIVLSRHVEYLRIDTKLKAFFSAGDLTDGKLIKHVPLGNNLEVAMLPMLFAMIPLTVREGMPGAFKEDVTIRDVMRFQTSNVTGSEPLYEPGMLSMVNALAGVVMGPGARQLNYTTVSSGEVGLCSRVEMGAVNVIPLSAKQEGAGANVYDIEVDWIYRTVVNVGTNPRLWPLVTVGE